MSIINIITELAVIEAIIESEKKLKANDKKNYEALGVKEK